jgi:tetratricopeptide (TPR) repeat protein
MEKGWVQRRMGLILPGIFAGVVGAVVIVVYLHQKAFAKGNELRLILKKAQDRSDAGEFGEAIKLYESKAFQALEKSPAIRAKVDYQRGLCYLRLARSDNPRSNLVRAVPLLERAAVAFGRLNKQTEQVVAMKELGKACNILGKIENRRSYPETAVRILNRALEIMASRQNTGLYAALESNLGFAYLNLYEIGKQPDDLARAIRVLETSFTYYQSHHQPSKLAQIELNLSICHKYLSQYEERETNLAKAFELARAARALVKREQDPMNYARIQAHMGRIYLELPQTGTKNPFCLAFRCFKQALRVYRLSEHPLEYGEIQCELAKVYQIFGEAASNLHKFQRALGAIDKALQVFGPDATPSNYFSALFTKADLYEKMAGLGHTEENLLNASRGYQLMLKSATAQSNPEIFTTVTYKLGMLHYKLAEFGETEKRLAEAVCFLTKALRANRFPSATELHQAENCQTDAWYQLDKIKATPGNIENLVEAFRVLTAIYSPEETPEEYADSQSRLGNALRKLAEFTARPAHLEEAVIELTKAAEVLEQSFHPKTQAAVLTDLGEAQLELAETTDPQINLEKAVGCFQKADRFYSDPKRQKELAHVRLDQGRAYYRLGLEKRDPDILSNAVKAFDDACKILNHDERSSDCLSAMYGLGLAHSRLVGFNEESRYNLIKAAGYLKTVLKSSSWPPKLDLLRAQEEYAWVLMNLADYCNATEHLREAIRQFETVLPHYSGAEKVSEYGNILNHLAVCYQKLTDVSLMNKQDNLVKSIEFLESALQRFSTGKYSLDWAMTENNLGISYSRLAKLTDREANLARALLAFEAALKIYTPKAYPEEYQKVKENIRRLTR